MPESGAFLRKMRTACFPLHKKKNFYANRTLVNSLRSSASISRMASRIALPVIFVASGCLFSGGCCGVAGNRFCLTVADNGTGYPPAVLAALQGTPQNEQTPHILGLHVVEQIAAAHGGRVVFGQNAPNGAKATVWLPCAEKRPLLLLVRMW